MREYMNIYKMQVICMSWRFKSNGNKSTTVTAVIELKKPQSEEAREAKKIELRNSLRFFGEQIGRRLNANDELLACEHIVLAPRRFKISFWTHNKRNAMDLTRHLNSHININTQCVGINISCTWECKQHRAQKGEKKTQNKSHEINCNITW